MIVLSREATDGPVRPAVLGRIDLSVRRNGYGRQLRSFEAPLRLAGDDRRSRGVHPGATRGARGRGRRDPRLARRRAGRRGAGSIMVAAFHPELTGDGRLHQRFLARVDEADTRAVA